MPFASCCRRGFGSVSATFKELTRAAAKSTAARLRRAGMLPTRVNWSRRAIACERCPLRVIRKNVSYCGTPFLQMPYRDPATQGCGCPTHDKAKSPTEHCPLTASHLPASTTLTSCDCKWCKIDEPRTEIIQ